MYFDLRHLSTSLESSSASCICTFIKYMLVIMDTSLEKFPNLRTHHITLWFVDIFVVRSVVVLL